MIMQAIRTGNQRRWGVSEGGGHFVLFANCLTKCIVIGLLVAFRRSVCFFKLVIRVLVFIVYFVGSLNPSGFSIYKRELHIYVFKFTLFDKLQMYLNFNCSKYSRVTLVF